MTIRRHLSFLFMPVIGLLGASGAATVAAAAPPVEPPVDAPVEPVADSAMWLFDDDDREITGWDRSARLDVTIPPGWKVSAPARLDLSYVIGSNASGLLSVSVNGALLDDVLLDRSAPSVTLAIPADAFGTGVNVVELAAAIDLVIDRECDDPSHPARRLDLDERTTLTVPVAPTGPIGLGDFPAVLEPVGMADRTLELHIIGPASGDTISAAAELTAAVREASERPIGLVVEVHESSEFDGDLIDPKRPSIVIGLDDDVRAATLLSEPTDAASVLLQRGDDGHPILIVTGTDGADLMENAERLASHDQVEAPPIESRFTLLDLEYDSRVIEGPGRDSTVYGFDVPINGVPLGGSITVDARRSTGATGLEGVGVIVNGRRIGLVEFEASGRTDTEPLEIPQGSLRPGRNLVHLDADFSKQAAGCVTGDRDQSVEIEPTTSVDLAAAGGTVELDLDDLPFTFRQPDDAAALTVVLPVKPTSEEIADAVDLAELLGGGSHPGRIAIADQLDDSTFESHHLVLLGEPSRQPVLARLDLGSMPDSTPTSEGSIWFVVRDDAPGQLVLVISGFDDAQTRAAAAALLAVETRATMTGGAVSVVSDGDVTEIMQTAQTMLVELGTADANDGDGTIDTTEIDEQSEAPEEAAPSAAPAPVAEATSTPIDGAGDDAIMNGYGFEGIVALLLGLAALGAFGFAEFNRRRRSTPE